VLAGEKFLLKQKDVCRVTHIP